MTVGHVRQEKDGHLPHMLDCDSTRPQIFFVPLPGTVGPIRLRDSASLCLDATGGFELQFWHCASAPMDNILFEVPSGRKGPIHMAFRRSMCLDVPEKKPAFFRIKAMQVWDCHHRLAGVNQQFHVRYLDDDEKTELEADKI